MGRRCGEQNGDQHEQTAGFEWGSGFYINPTPPEQASTYLRGVDWEEAIGQPGRFDSVKNR